MIIGICDDNKREHPYLMQLCDLHGTYSYLHYYSGEALLHSQELPELLFLDIKLPGLDGLDVMRKLELLPSSPYIIFYTSHMELLPDAFGKKVIGFLQKPATDGDVEKCLIHAQRLFTMEGYITFDKNKKAFYYEVTYIESSRNYTIFHLLNGETIISRTAISKWANSLPACFSYIHRTYIVNLHHVTMHEKTHFILNNTNQETLPISRRRQKKVIQEYEDFLFQWKSM